MKTRFVHEVDGSMAVGLHQCHQLGTSEPDTFNIAIYDPGFDPNGTDPLITIAGLGAAQLHTLADAIDNALHP